MCVSEVLREPSPQQTPQEPTHSPLTSRNAKSSAARAPSVAVAVAAMTSHQHPAELEVGPAFGLMHTRAYRRSAKRYGHTLLGYGNDPRGHVRLRTAVGQMVSAVRGLSADPDSVMVVRGSQMALDLVGRSLVRPGDVVAVEALGYAPAFNVFRRAEAEVVPIAVDRHGIDVGALAALTRRKRVRLIYVTPHHQYPTTVMLSPTRRLELLDLARREHIAILEDDYDQEFHYDGRPVLPLASSDHHGSVIYIGTLAKILAPGLRLGFVVAPAPLSPEWQSSERSSIDKATRSWSARLPSSSRMARSSATFDARGASTTSDATPCAAAVDEHFGDVLSYQRPAGGLALWAAVAPRIDLDLWQKRAIQKGVYFQLGRQFTFDGSAPKFARFGYATVDERELRARSATLFAGARTVSGALSAIGKLRHARRLVGRRPTRIALRSLWGRDLFFALIVTRG